MSAILDPILSWTLQLPLFLSLAILALAITLIVNVVYKYATDQNEMKRLKKRQKELQAEIRKHKDNPKKMMKVQGEAMQVNMDYMKRSMKPTLFTILPLLIIFAWMNAHFTFAPIAPGEDLRVQVELEVPSQVTIETNLAVQGEQTKDTIEKQVAWSVSGDAGTHILTFTTDTGESAEYSVLIADVPKDARKVIKKLDAPFKTAKAEYPRLKPLGDVSILGWKPGWLGVYIILSIVFSLVTRKLMGIH